jgi:two-component sensor histidine kinase
MLFTNEAMTNACEHALPQANGRGNVSVSLQPAENGEMALVITDDGQEHDPANGLADNTMGGRLMKAFSKQVSGEMSLHTRNGGGTIVTLHFPVNVAGTEKVKQEATTAIGA